MKHETFNEILEERIKKMRFTLAAKADEYAADEDRLHNFRKAGAILGCSSERALVGMFAKHLVSVLDIVDAVDGDRSVSDAVIDEKIGDAVNYLVLLEALLRERTAWVGIEPIPHMKFPAGKERNDLFGKGMTGLRYEPVFIPGYEPVFIPGYEPVFIPGAVEAEIHAEMISEREA